MAIAPSRYNLQAAIQTARGIYPTVPTFHFRTAGAGLSNQPTIDKLNICDGRIWAAARKRYSYVETGGQPDLICGLDGLGLLLYGALGAKSSTPGAPDVHVFTPATSFTGFPYFTFWNFFDDEWHLFRDCQVVGLEFTVSTDAKFAICKPTIIGMAKQKSVAAPASQATPETDEIHWLDAGGYHFIGGDYVNALHTTLPTDLATAKTYLAALKTAWNAHCAVATGRHHKAADAVNTLAFLTPVADLAACIAACTEIRTDFLAHLANTTVHYFADVLNVISHANPTDLPTVLSFCQELGSGLSNTPGDYNCHLGSRPGARSLTASIDMAATPIQGEDLVPYTIQRKPGGINVAMDLLQEDFELINLALYGDPNPAAETEQTTEIQTLSMYNKFIAQTVGEEHSLAVLVPQFDFDPEPLSGLGGNPEGTEIIAPIGGEASGTDPVITFTLMNSTAGY